MPFLTTEEARRYLPQLTGEGSLVDALAAAVETDAARFLGFPETAAGGWSLASAPYVVHRNGPAPRGAGYGGSRVLQLPVRPVSAVAEVVQSSDWDWGAADAAVSSAQFVLVSERGQIWLKPSASVSWRRGPRAIRVTFTGGWSTSGPDDRPEDLVDALAFWTAHRFHSRHRGGKTKASGKSGSVDMRPETMPARVRETLRGYRAVSALL